MAYGYTYVKALKSYMTYPRHHVVTVPTKKVEVKPTPTKYVRTVRVKCPKCGQELIITITVE